LTFVFRLGGRFFFASNPEYRPTFQSGRQLNAKFFNKMSYVFTSSGTAIYQRALMKA
jgi:hypothetical protein